MQRMNSIHELTTILVMFILVTGCGSSASGSNPTPIASRLTQAASDIGDFESTSTIAPSLSFTPFPRMTPNPSRTDVAQSTEQSLIAGFPHICEQDYALPTFSPNRLWLVELCYSENDQDLIMTLSNSQAQLLWKLLYQEYLPKMDFVPDGGMAVVHWSNDGRYAYFTAFLGGDGGECFYGNQLETGTGLFRLDLQTGRTTAILPPNDMYYWYGFSVSPTDRRLIYGVHSRDLKILDMRTGQLMEVVHKSDFSQGGEYVWSPDGLQFVYSTATSDYQADQVSYSLRLVDAQSGSEQLLLESPDHCFAATSWTEKDILIVERDYGEAIIEFDLNSRKILSEATVTPYP